MKIICVSHDPETVLNFAGHVLVMNKGKVIQQGTPEEIYRNPESEAIAGLTGLYSIYERQILRPDQLKFSKGSNFQVRQSYLTASGYLIDIESPDRLLVAHNKRLEPGSKVDVKVK